MNRYTTRQDGDDVIDKDGGRNIGKQQKRGDTLNYGFAKRGMHKPNNEDREAM